MASTVQSVARAFDILKMLNRNNGSTVNVIAKTTELPRGTAFRLVTSLCALGYCRRDPDSGRIWLTSEVQDLSAGYSEVDRFVEAAEPLIDELAKEVQWPVTLTTPKEKNLISRITTDLLSPFTEIRSRAGIPLRLIETAAGFVYLAYSSEKKRQTLLSYAARHSTTEKSVFEEYLTILRFEMPGIRRNGYAYVRGKTRSSAIAVPILRRKKFIGSISMRFFDSALDRRTLEIEYVPILKRYAEQVETISRQA